ncbi:MAG: alpha/beta hydrolase [Pseudomonadota bacterium]
MTNMPYFDRTTAPAPGGPLLVALHGTGGDEHQFFDMARTLMPGAGVISPRGDVLEGHAARFFRRTAEGVYDMDDLARATAKMAGYVHGFKSKYPGAPVFGFGYSNGANILAATLFAHPGVFDRAALLHPLVPWRPAPVDLAGTDILVTAGRRDPIGPWPMTQALLGTLRHMGAHVTTEIHDGGHELRQTEFDRLGAWLRAKTPAASLATGGTP